MKKHRIKRTHKMSETVSKPPVVTKALTMRPKEENIDIEKMVRKQFAIERRHDRRSPSIVNRTSYGVDLLSGSDGLKTLFYDPLSLESNAWGSVRTISPYYGRQISCRILRRVSEKAWILNLCIANIIKKIRPYLKPVTQDNQRGFRIKNINADASKIDLTEKQKKEIEALQLFFMQTGDVEDDNREDDLDKYTTKIIRDLCQLDQISTEIQRTNSGDVCAFWAIDTATVEVALPESEKMTGIKYAQVIHHIPYAYYTRNELLFDCMNPRTDIEKAGYGYSIVEQAIDLITSSINTFMYNAGFFTENKLPRGILLLNGDADTDEVEDIEDYISNLMSGPPTSQWRVPIIPSGKNNGGDAGRRFEWVNLQGTNKEMEYQAWFDLQLSGIVGLFGFSMEDLGLHSQKSQPLIGADTNPKVENSKSLVLGDMLSFLQKHFNKILSYKNTEYVFEFVGYEKSDERLVMEMDKSEVETYKSVDEKRIEKGLDPFEKEWSQVPLNPYVIQLIGQQQSGGMFDSEEGGSDFGETETGDSENTEAKENTWDDVVSDEKPIQKSIGKSKTIRIVI